MPLGRIESLNSTQPFLHLAHLSSKLMLLQALTVDVLSGSSFSTLVPMSHCRSSTEAGFPVNLYVCGECVYVYVKCAFRSQNQ